MSKKRTLKANALQVDFWTALPIGACRERIVDLQHTKFVRYRYFDTSSVLTSTNSTFTLVHIQRLTPWHSLSWKQGYREEIQFTLAGTLQATADGTRVTLGGAPDMHERLWIEVLRTIITISISSLWLCIFGQGLLNALFSPTDATVSGILCFGLPTLGLLMMMVATLNRMRFLFRTARMLLDSVRDDLYATQYIPPLN